MRTPSPICAVVVVALIASPVFAHEDYEEVIATLTTPDGREFEVVRHWTDGIVVYDPAKLVLRLPNGEVLAETEYRRNILVSEASDNRWLAFTAEPWNVFYHRAWWIENGELILASDFAHIPRAFVAGVRQHMLAYATGVSLMVAAFSAWRATRCSGNAWRCVSLIAFSCFGVVIATLLAWIWWRTLTGNGQGDVFEALVITTIAGMFAIFCFRVCRTRSGTVALCTNLAWIWMLLIALYGSALPLSILLVGALISLVLHLLVEKNTCAKVSPVSY